MKSLYFTQGDVYMNYDVTEYKEIFREVFACLLADIDRELEKRGIKQSMSRKGNCLDNSPTENFNMIWGELLSDKYSTMEDMLKLKGIFEFTQDYVRGLAPGTAG